MKGSCLCGVVRLAVDGPLEHAPESCHCVQCRRWSSHGFDGVNVRRSALRIEGEDHVRWFRSSPEVDRGFCGDCGSILFWRPTRAGYAWTSVSMGVFDRPTGTRLAKHTFVGEKGDYYEIADGLPQNEAF